MSQLFDSSLKAKIEQADRIANAVAYLSSAIGNLNGADTTRANFLSLLDAIARNPPIFTVYKLAGPDGAAFNVVSPEPPLFNFLA